MPISRARRRQKKSGLAVNRAEIIHRDDIRCNGESSHRFYPKRTYPVKSDRLLGSPHVIQSIALRASRVGGNPKQSREGEELGSNLLHVGQSSPASSCVR